MRTCWYCEHNYHSLYDDDDWGFHMNVCLLGMRRDDIDLNDNDVCYDCMIFIDHDQICALCETEFDSIEAFKEHVLQNKIRCTMCQEFDRGSDKSYCVNIDCSYVCETCSKGYLTKPAR